MQFAQGRRGFEWQETGVALHYNIYDVFTETKMAGNPLAVMYEADDLDQGTMQAIAREMNLSETVFINRSSNPAHAASLRIFTPSGELPFAGHPTVGAAVAIAERNRGDGDDDIDMVCVLEEKVGPVRCAVKMRAGAVSFAEFDLPRRSSRVDLPSIMPPWRMRWVSAKAISVLKIMCHRSGRPACLSCWCRCIISPQCVIWISTPVCGCAPHRWLRGC